MLFGARTGRDGIGGASVLACAELGEDDAAKRPTVQIGDPFEEKKLLECSLELLDRGLLVSLQDLGAAGLTSSSSEMASKGEVGLDIDVRRVPLREADMEPFEIMISESQERMLCVVEPARVDAVLAVCARWEVNGDRRSARSPTRAACACSTTARSSATCPVAGARRRLPALRARAGAAGRRALPGAAARARGRASTSRETLLGAARLGQPRLAPLGVRAVRLARRLAHRAPAGGVPTPPCWCSTRAPGATGAPRPAIAVSIDGNGRRVAVRPLPRRGRGRARVLGQPRLRRAPSRSA